MGDDKKQYSVIDQPSMTTIVTKEYFIPPFTEVVIHKKFFQTYTLFLLATVSALWAIGLWTDWYIIATHAAYNFALTHWYITAGFIGLGSLALLLVLRDRAGKRPLSKAERERLEYLDRKHTGRE